MKRRILPLLLLCVLLLSGCGTKKEEARFRRFAEDLAARQTLSFRCRLRADWPDRRADFTLSFSRDEEGDAVTVLAPESIAGITARLTEAGGSLCYDDLILDLGALDAGGLSPVGALPLLVNAMAGAHLDSCWSEDGQAVYALTVDDDRSVRVWFTPENMVPRRAQLLSGGRAVITCEIEDWR